MTFNDASEVSQCCWNLKLGDFKRGKNRAQINELFNGFPPYSDQEVAENNIEINCNFLESCRLAHDARSQFNNAFCKPGNYFTCRTDMGPVHKRAKWGAIVTREMNRIMKRSLPYYEKFRSTFAQDVLHGIGPGTWPDRDSWCPDPAGVEDILIPGKTLLTMKNLPLYAQYRSFSGPELIALTRKPKVDPGWNMTLVNKCLEWIDSESVRLMGSNWPEVWAPEKLSERIKSDGGFYVADDIPTIECFDFYFYDGDSKDTGWRRRIVLDSWAVSDMGSRQPVRKNGDIYRNDGMFLYDGGSRKFADHLSEMLSFQFADLSAVAPFRYHSVRSLGFLLYSVCHLQNRLRCRFNEAVFESLMMYFRVKSMDDVQRALKLELINRGFIEEGIQPLTAQERYQVNTPLVQLGIQQNQQIITENSSSYVQQPNYSQGGVEKTKFQVMAETNAMTSLVSAAFNQAYTYQVVEYREIARRFFRPESKDPDVTRFQAACLRQSVPEKVMVVEAWDLEPERVMGAGNKTLETTIAQQLMEWRPMFDPEPQRDILRDAVLAITDDAAKAESLVPDQPVKVTDSVHDAQLAAGTLMQGLPVAVKTGMNHIEYIETLLQTLAVAIQKAKLSGNVASPQEILGMRNIEEHINQHLMILAQADTEKPRAKAYAQQLGKLMNEVKAFEQRLMQQMQEQAQSGNGQMDPKDAAKIQAMQMQAQVKAENAKVSHAERTAQKQISWERDQQRKAEQHALDMQKQALELQADIQAKDLQTAAEVSRARARESAKPKPKASEE